MVAAPIVMHKSHHATRSCILGDWFLCPFTGRKTAVGSRGVVAQSVSYVDAPGYHHDIAENMTFAKASYGGVGCRLAERDGFQCRQWRNRHRPVRWWRCYGPRTQPPGVRTAVSMWAISTPMSTTTLAKANWRKAKRLLAHDHLADLHRVPQRPLLSPDPKFGISANFLIHAAQISLRSKRWKRAWFCWPISTPHFHGESRRDTLSDMH